MPSVNICTLTPVSFPALNEDIRWFEKERIKRRHFDDRLFRVAEERGSSAGPILFDFPQVV